MRIYIEKLPGFTVRKCKVVRIRGDQQTFVAKETSGLWKDRGAITTGSDSEPLDDRRSQNG